VDFILSHEVDSLYRIKVSLFEGMSRIIKDPKDCGV